MEKFVAILFFVGLVAAAIMWLPEQLGINSVWCVGGALLIGILVVFGSGFYKGL